MGWEAVLDHRVQDSAGAVEVELDSVDVLDTLASQREAYELWVPEELRAVGRKRQG